MAETAIAQLPLNLYGVALDGIKVCMECGNPLEIRCARDLIRKRYCSRKCRSKSTGRNRNRFLCHEIRTCRGCMGHFTASHSRQLYCSKSCQGADATKRWEARHGSLEFHIQRLSNRVVLSKGEVRSRVAISKQFLMDMWTAQDGKCAISGVSMTYVRGVGFNDTNASLDRIDPSRGYTTDNVQLVCRIVNIMRHDLELPEFFHWLRTILGNNHAIGLTQTS